MNKKINNTDKTVTSIDQFEKKGKELIDIMGSNSGTQKNDDALADLLKSMDVSQYMHMLVDFMEEYTKEAKQEPVSEVFNAVKDRHSFVNNAVVDKSRYLPSKGPRYNSK